MSTPEAPEAPRAPTEVGRGTQVALVVLVLFAAWSRAPAFLDWWLNPDEGINYLAATGSWKTFWRTIYYNAHPPLTYFVLRACTVFSDAFAVLRIPGYLAGLATVPAGFLLGRELAGDPSRANWTGLVVALGLAASPSVVMQAQVMRPYSLLLALVILAAWALSRFLRTGCTRDLVAYSLLLSIALFTHYSAALFATASFLVLVAARLSGRSSTQSLGRLVGAYVLPAAVILACLYWHLVPFLLAAAEGLGVHLDSPLEPTGPLHALELLGPALFETLDLIGAGDHAHTAAAVLLVAGLGLAWTRGRRTLVVWVVGTCIAAALAFISGKYPLQAQRRCIWMTPFLILPIAEVLVALLADKLILARALAVAGLVVLWGYPVGLGLLWKKAGGSNWEQLLPRSEAQASIDFVEGLPENVPATFGHCTRFLLSPVLSESGPSEDRIALLRWGERPAFHLVTWTARLDEFEPEYITRLRDWAAKASGVDPTGPVEVAYVSTKHSGGHPWVSSMTVGQDGVLETKVSEVMCVARIDLTAYLRARRAAEAAPQE
jgi:hypothetical protein